jgi:hypothetical protein
MAGIGIAAAIGFVFALSFLVNTGSVGDGGTELTQPAGQERTGELTAGEDSAGDATLTAKDAAPGNENVMMVSDLRPALASVVIVDSNEVVGEVVPGTEFELGKQVVIRASYKNPNEIPISEHFVAMSIRSAGSGEDLVTQDGEPSEHGASVQTDIAPGGTVELELYWTPGRSGEYTLLLFSITPADLASTEPVRPTVIPITVGK